MKALQYQVGELTEKYLTNLQRRLVRFASGYITRPSPLRISKNISPDWIRYLDRIPLSDLMVKCRSIILVISERYMLETDVAVGRSEAGWVWEEFQLVLSLLKNDPTIRVISVLIEGKRVHSGLPNRPFPLINFLDKSAYADNIDLLICYLRDPFTPPDWLPFMQLAHETVQCSECNLKAPLSDLPPKICTHCGEWRPADRALCHLCGYNIWRALILPPHEMAAKPFTAVVTHPVGQFTISNICSKCKTGLLIRIKNG